MSDRPAESATDRVLHAIGADAAFAEAVLGDLAEEYAERAARDGGVAARAWYVREAVRTMPYVLWNAARRGGPRARAWLALLHALPRRVGRRGRRREPRARTLRPPLSAPHRRRMSTPALGSLELTVLLSVARLADDAYGLAIRRDLADRTGRDYSVGAVYTTLQRLEDKGLLTSRASDPLPVRGGRSRRHFTLTGAGTRALRAAERHAASVWAGVGTIAPRPA